MSGIAVIYNRVDPDVDHELLERFVQHLAWRGPDQAGTWYEGHVGLGATQLWTTIEDWGAEQPVVSRDGRCALAFDGRLDNRPELQAELGLPAGNGQTLSDAELVLATYLRWGESFPQRLAGPFSTAVWDRRDQRLVCARDPIGQRPLFYRSTGRHLYMASSIEPLRSVPGVTTTLNDDYVWDFLCTSGTVGSLVPEETPFSEILRLPPGHTLVATPREVRVERHWKPWDMPSLEYGDDREYAEHFRELFTTVVRAQNRAAGPVCATLSGGLDSSSVVCASRELERSGALTGEPLQTLSLVWDDAAGYDEREFVDAVIAKHPGPAHLLPDERFDSFDLFTNATTSHDEPFSLLGRFWSSLSEKTSALGSRVLLAGSGGDHLLSGNNFQLADLLRRGAVRKVARQLHFEAHKRDLPYPGLIAAYLISPHLPRHLGPRLVAALTKPPDQRQLDAFYYWHVPEWLPDRSSLSRRGRERHKLVRKRFSSFAAQRDYEQLGVGSLDHQLLPLYHIALANGVDLRNPFFDTRLASFCLRLPPSAKYRDGLTKRVLRLGLQDVLPDKVANRRDKTSYNFAMADHIRRNWMSIRDVYEQSEAQRQGYLNASLLLDAIAPLQQGGSGSLHLPSIAAAFSLEDWLRRIDNPSSGRLAEVGSQ